MCYYFFVPTGDPTNVFKIYFHISTGEGNVAVVLTTPSISDNQHKEGSRPTEAGNIGAAGGGKYFKYRNCAVQT